MSRWFRMYDELLDDPKVQRLSGDDFKAWVNILCLASRKDGTLPPVADIGFALRLDAKKAAAIVARLVAAELMDQDGDRYAPHGWNARQYKSDVSTGRVKAFRERKKGVAGNADETFHETAPDTEPDTDSSVAKATGPKPDSDQVFWEGAKTFLSAETKNPGALVGKWCRDHTKVITAEVITRAQLERPAQRIPFIEGCFRAKSREREYDQPLV